MSKSPLTTAGGIPVPRATYRLQFNKDFQFDAAAALTRYMARLGISHLYASPLTTARLWLCAATATVLRNGLGVLGVSAPERM